MRGRGNNPPPSKECKKNKIIIGWRRIRYLNNKICVLTVTATGVLERGVLISKNIQEEAEKISLKGCMKDLYQHRARHSDQD